MRAKFLGKLHKKTGKNLLFFLCLWVAPVSTVKGKHSMWDMTPMQISPCCCCGLTSFLSLSLAFCLGMRSRTITASVGAAVGRIPTGGSFWWWLGGDACFFWSLGWVLAMVAVFLRSRAAFWCPCCFCFLWKNPEFMHITGTKCRVPNHQNPKPLAYTCGIWLYMCNILSNLTNSLLFSNCISCLIQPWIIAFY